MNNSLIKPTRLASFGPLALGIFIFVSGLLVMTAFRVAFSIHYHERLVETSNYLKLFPVGLRMDVLLMSYLTILPTLFLLIFPKKIISYFRYIFSAWATFMLTLIFYMEIATFPFMQEYDLRPDRKFLEYLKHPKEVLGTLFGAYKLELLIGTVAVVVATIFIWRASAKVLATYHEFNWKVRFFLLPIVIALLVLGARSTLGHRPANLSTAVFSNNHLANELALNSTYTMSYAAYRLFSHEESPLKMFGGMEDAEVLTRVKKNATISAADYIVDGVPMLHSQKSAAKLDRPMNVVIFLQESVGAVDVGCLKGPDITPNLCALKDEGLWFSEMYATGTRTVRGIEATVSGFLPTVNQGVVKLELAKRDFFTAASLFKKHGYETEFIYGGMSNFDEMCSFFVGNGFEKIYDEPTFRNPVFKGTWGVSDEDLVRKANEVFVAHGDKPFFSLLLSTSNHTPYEFPDGRIELHEEPKATHYNAVKYADYAIGLLMELAKKEDYYKNTLFLIVADHNSHVRGNDLVPVDKYQVPALLLGPNVPKMNFSIVSSQVDLLPTILNFSGLDTIHPMLGRNLMALPEGTPGRSFMQNENNNAYRVGDQVIISQPYLAPLQFIIKDDKLIPTELDPELARDALAHIHLPWLQYSKKLYTIPN